MSATQLCDLALAVQKLRTDLDAATRRLREYDCAARELDAALNPPTPPVRHFVCFMCNAAYGMLGGTRPPRDTTAQCGHSGKGWFCHSEVHLTISHTDKRCALKPADNKCYACRQAMPFYLQLKK